MQAGETRLQLTLQSINDIVRRVDCLPGRRTIVFLSPGMYVVEEQAALTDYLNRAIRAGVVINTLDIRGLYTESANGVDVSLRGSGTGVYPAAMSTYSAASAAAQSDAMMQIAYATGGNYFHNRNDLDGGLGETHRGAGILVPAGVHSARPEEPMVSSTRCGSDSSRVTV